MKAAVFNRTTSQFDYLVDVSLMSQLEFDTYSFKHVKPEVGTNELLVKVEICSLSSIDRDLLTVSKYLRAFSRI